MASRRQPCSWSGVTCERYSVTDARMFSELRDEGQLEILSARWKIHT